MVKERSPSRTSSGQYLSPQKRIESERRPLANIGAKMQSPSPRQQQQQPQLDNDQDVPLKAGPQVEFGKASTLRNALKKPEPNIFIPKPKPAQKISPKSRPFISSAAQEAQSGASLAEGRPFYLPSQVQGARPSAQQSTFMNAQEYLEQPYKISFAPEPVDRQKPVNARMPTIQPRPPPTFSSHGGNTFYPPYSALPPQAHPLIDLTKNAIDEEDFNADEAIRAEGEKFGAVDPHIYVDSAQANENIKSLLEGAFDDDEDKSRTRLRKRAKRAMQEGKGKEAQSLADKLAAMNVKQEDEAKPETEQNEDEGEDDGTVEGLAVKLLPHQVEGVAWMINKEIGVRKAKAVLPHGGILADDMGLGKTVQSVALILTNPRPALNAKPEHPKQKLPGKDVGKGTLVVAPLAVIKQWEDEIKTKVTRSYALQVLVHHGPNRTKSSAELKKYDVVITTYQTLTSEHAGSNMALANGTRIGCFGVHWYRLILDEAHSIKNRNAKSTLACCALESWYRWCLTGTPMQNNLDELQSLIKFLRIKPFCELPSWKDQITQPLKNGRGWLAMRRLQVFLKTFMKRRTKDILKKEGALNFSSKIADKEGAEKKEGMKIVNREVLTVKCDFDEIEQEFYLRLQDRADRRLKEMINEKHKADYIGALVLLLRLRQACNHPYLIEMAMNKDKDAMTTGMSSQSGSQTPKKGSRGDDGEMDNLAMLMGDVSVAPTNCDVCQVVLSATEVKDGAVRCKACEADLKMMKRSKKEKTKSTKEKTTQRRQQYKLPYDSDNEGEGTWIGDGPEQQVDLGRAGGTDDEDAEGGGETLGSIDSEQSTDGDENEEDSPPRARRWKPNVQTESEEEDEVDSDGETSGCETEITPKSLRTMPFHKSKHRPSTKIRKLLRILKMEAPHHKSIVFSQFTSMLDLVEPHLEHAGLRYARYDGSMRNDAREASLQSLRNNPKTRVLLCSLKCGSLGLNLTAASRVIILEPFWNPFVEEQAIDRVHRLNQTVDVKVYRLTIRATVEERILELQERKRELAKAAIEGGKAVGKLSMADMLKLFRHDAQDTEHHEEDREMWRKFGGDTKLFDGSSAGLQQLSDPGSIGRRPLSSGVKPGKETLSQEHDVYGRRW